MNPFVVVIMFWDMHEDFRKLHNFGIYVSVYLVFMIIINIE